MVAGGVHGCRGVCMVAGGACMVARGAYMVVGGDMCGCWGACMVTKGEHAWLWGGMCGCWGGMHGCQGACGCWGACMVAGGHAWLGGMCGRGGACVGYDEIRSMSGRYASYWNALMYVTAIPCFDHRPREKDLDIYHLPFFQIQVIFFGG